MGASSMAKGLLVPLGTLSLVGSAIFAPLPVRADPTAAAMAQLATKSPMYKRAHRTVSRAVAGLRDRRLRAATRDALLMPGTCIRHRVGLDAHRQAQIVATLTARGLLAGESREMRRALFPPLAGEGSACPHLITPILAAAGGNSGSHHSWPGGLAVHLAGNLESARALMRSAGMRRNDRVTAAVLWHDWAKALVLAWRDDGITAPEPQLAGTGAHHVLGLAESMKRGVDPGTIAAQACAHSADMERVARWIEAASIVAGTDRLHYPVAASPECLINHLADQNWMFGDTAVAAAEARLASEAAEFGFDPAEIARFNRCYRNPILAELGADVLFVAPSPRLWRSILRRAHRAPFCSSPRD